MNKCTIIDKLCLLYVSYIFTRITKNYYSIQSLFANTLSIIKLIFFAWFLNDGSMIQHCTASWIWSDNVVRVQCILLWLLNNGSVLKEIKINDRRSSCDHGLINPEGGAFSTCGPIHLYSEGLRREANESNSGILVTNARPACLSSAHFHVSHSSLTGSRPSASLISLARFIFNDSIRLFLFH